MAHGVISYEKLLNDINKREFVSVYLFHGGEKYLLKKVVNLLKEKLLGKEDSWNYQELEAQDLDDNSLFSNLNILPMFGEYRLLVVKGADKYFGDGKNRSLSEKEKNVLLNYLESADNSSVVVFVVDGKVDGRTKLYKRAKELGAVVEFAPLTGKRSIRWLSGRLDALGIKMEKEAFEYFAAAAGSSAAHMEQELQKLLLYTNNRRISLDIVKDTMSKSTRVNIFEIVDAIGEKDAVKSISLLREMLAMGEPPVYIAHMIARQFRLILHVKCLMQEGYSEKQIISRLKLHPFVCGKISRQSRNFEIDDLHDCLNQVLRLDLDLKTSSKEPAHLFELAVLSICC